MTNSTALSGVPTGTSDFWYIKVSSCEAWVQCMVKVKKGFFGTKGELQWVIAEEK